jgi:ABC-type branched-subunit amino acid transport system substrate-binding protein
MNRQRVHLRTRTCLVVLCSVATLAACGSSTSGTGSASSPVKIGAVWSITGADAAYGQTFEQGTAAAVAYVNSHGGIHGHPVAVVTHDDESTPIGAAAAVKALVGSGNTVAIVGDDLSDDVLAEAAAVESAKVPLFSAASANEIYDTNTYHYTFLTQDTATQRATFDVQYLANTLGLTKIGILYEVGAYGTTGEQQTLPALKAIGQSAAPAVSFPAGSLDTSTQIKQLKADGVDGLILWTLGPPLISSLRSMYNLGLRVPTVAPGISPLATNGLSAATLTNIYGGPTSKYILHAPNSVASSQGAQYLDSFKKVVQTEGVAATADVLDGWVAFQDVLDAVAAIRAAKSLTPAGVTDAAESGTKLVAAGFVHAYSASNHIGYRSSDYGMFAYVNGKACDLQGCFAAPQKKS